MKKKDPRRSTSLIAHEYLPPAGFMAVQPSVHKASTVVFANTAALRARSWKEKTGYTYGLLGTPTTFTLEERIATLEGGVHTVLVPSGLAAITVVDMALLKTGDELLIPDNAYGPNKDFARHELAGWGIAHRFYDPMDPASLRAAIGERTRLIWLEAPGSVTMEFPDLRRPDRHRARARRDDRARQHLGRRARVRSVPNRRRREQRPGRRRHLGAGLDQVPLRRWRRADGIGDDARRRPPSAHQGRKHAGRLRHRRQRRGARPPIAAVAARALRGAGPRRASAGRLVGRAARGRAGAPPGAGRITGARALEARVQRCRRPLLGGVRRALHACAGRRLRRCAEAVSHRLLVGRPGQPRRALRPGDDAREAALGRHAGALLARARGGRGPDRRLRAGARGAALESPRLRRRAAEGASTGPPDAIANDKRSSGSLPPGVSRRSISKRPSSVAKTIFISSIARWRPGHTRGPAPNGIETRLAELAPGPLSGSSQRCGSKVVARSKYSFSKESLRKARNTSVPAGTRMSATTLSRNACSVSEGATGFSRIVSLAQASIQARRAKRSGVQLAASPATASISARARARRSGWLKSSQIAQARVFAVVSSPASNIVITFPDTSSSVIPEPASSAATIMASSRFAGAALRAGSARRRRRAAATKPSIAALTCNDACVEGAVGARAIPAPSREGREHATEHRRKDLVEVTLNDVFVRLERVDVGPEREAGDRVDGEAHQVGLQVDRLSSGGGALPAPFEAVANANQRRKVGAQVARVEPGHHHLALPLPGLALGAEEARAEADLAGDAGETWRAPKALGPVAQHRAHRLVVGDHKQAIAADRDGEEVAVAARPPFHLLVQVRLVDLQRVAEPRQAGRPRQVVDLAQPRRLGRGRRGARDGHADPLQYFAAQCFAGADTLWRISRPCSRSQSRFFSVLRLSCSALPLASAISALTRPPL